MRKTTAARPAAGPLMQCLAVCAASIPPVSAAAQDWIVGVAAGSATHRDYAIGASIASRDDADAGSRLFIGYRIGAMQAVVASYVDLGVQTYAGAAFGGFRDRFEADGFDLSYVAGWAPGEQQRLSIFGSVGVMNFDQDVLLTDAAGQLAFRDEGTSFTFGFGTEVNLASNGRGPWGIHLSYQRFADVGDPDNSGLELDRDLLSIGIAYRFRRSR